MLSHIGAQGCLRCFFLFNFDCVLFSISVVARDLRRSHGNTNFQQGGDRNRVCVTARCVRNIRFAFKLLWVLLFVVCVVVVVVVVVVVAVVVVVLLCVVGVVVCCC